MHYNILDKMYIIHSLKIHKMDKKETLSQEIPLELKAILEKKYLLERLLLDIKARIFNIMEDGREYYINLLKGKIFRLEKDGSLTPLKELPNGKLIFTDKKLGTDRLTLSHNKDKSLFIGLHGLGKSYKDFYHEVKYYGYEICLKINEMYFTPTTNNHDCIIKCKRGSEFEKRKMIQTVIVDIKTHTFVLVSNEPEEEIKEYKETQKSVVCY